ncbi:sugar ABC transporter ATP-binding protein [Ningiella sp. W23]|uniref:sugar ABC transporter ATP-binding protein n=1 Tax=Ningiella sp. W23 TaxID=3023715 RepID=UPI0037582A73
MPVLRGVDLKIAPGEICALVGENGAGKSTLINLLCGLLPKDDGVLLIDNIAYTPKNVTDAMENGVSVALQELSLIENLNLAENIFLRKLPQSASLIDRELMHAKARQLLDDFGLHNCDTYEKVERLSLAQKQLLELCKALSEGAKLLILDEPTAALSQQQSDILHTHMHRLAEGGMSILYVSHRLEDVLSHCDTVAVLTDGALVQTARAKDCSVKQLIKWMSKGILQNPKRERIQTTTLEKPPVVLRADSCTTTNLPFAINIELKQGEILGVAGLAGAGRTELLEALFGITPCLSGGVYRTLKTVAMEPGKGIKIRNSTHAVSLNIGMLSEDRKALGIFGEQSLDFNASIAKLKRATKGFYLSQSKINGLANALFDSLSVKYDALSQSIEELSGGNQQKILLARLLFAQTNVFLLDEPTRGVDVNTKALIYDKLKSLKEEGASCIVASSEIEELFKLSDRIIVMASKRIVGELMPSQFSNANVLNLAFSDHKNAELA